MNSHLSAEEARRLHDQAVIDQEAERQRIEEQRKQNRLRYPEATKFVDDVREIFGEVKVTYFGEPRPETLAVLKKSKP